MSLEDFLRTSALGPIRLAMAWEDVYRLLGDPDRLGGMSRRHRRPTILKYGDIELLYRPGEDALWGIYMDGFDIPQGGQSVSLDPWIIRGGMTDLALKGALESAAIAYTEEISIDDPTMLNIFTSSGVELGVALDPNEYSSSIGLHHIGRHL